MIQEEKTKSKQKKKEGDEKEFENAKRWNRGRNERKKEDVKLIISFFTFLIFFLF